MFLLSSSKWRNNYKEISHLLALGAESFEEELKKIVSNLSSFRIHKFSQIFFFDK